MAVRMRRPLSLFLIFLLVLTIAPAGAALSADLTSASCTNLLFAFSPACLLYQWSESFIDDDEADVLFNDIAIDVVTMEDGRTHLTQDVEALANQSYGIGVSEAKITVIEQLNNGSNESEAVDAAIEDIDEFYTQQQIRLLNQANREVLTFQSAWDSVNAHNEVNFMDWIPIDYCGETGDDYREPFVGEHNFTLFNGSVRTQHYAMMEDQDLGSETSAGNCNDPSGDGHLYGVTPGFKELDELDSASWNGDSHIPIVDAVENGSEHVMLDANSYIDAYATMTDRRGQAVNNVNQMAHDIYANFEPGDLDVSDVLGPLEALMHASSSYNDTGFYSYAAVSLQQMGLASNLTYGFEVQWNNTDMDEPQTAHGQLFVHDEDDPQFNGTLEVNTTYDASDTTVWFAHEVEDGAAERTEFDDEFRILSMTDTSTGETVNETSIQSTDFYTEDTSELEAQLEQLQNSQQQLLDDISGGILPDGWPNPFTWLGDQLGIPDHAAAVVAGVGIVILLLLLPFG
ncbi:hypothetical protein HTZ84_21175 [Haloterrigena sp. SYSU A558-1]|uniref:Envelope protein N-terminal domain-containing protein n=1 Tax=Haloterrigena gelatinilytica TaxID=2741724 RepID=A0ABX2LK43_9EURY|nr:hypothetical protein [Haloterrigena gelatinilytica]NUC74778.1 hypothetical protein [Haloterrigena gelatinilytica]